MERCARFIALLALLAACIVNPVNAQDQPSVAVQLTSLKKGSLPRTVTAYGAAEPSAAALRTVMAPTSAIVDEIDVRQGQSVAKDAPLVRLAPSPMTRRAYAEAQSALRVASDLVARTRSMVQQHLATAQQLADAEKSEADARAALAALEAQGAGGANVLKAPFDAVVTAITTTPGTIVAEGAALVTLADPGDLVLRVGVIPTEATSIAVGDPATIGALGTSSTLATRVALRGALVDPATGLIPVEIALPAGKFLPGQAGIATITTGEVEGYIVPHAAVLVDDQGQPYIVQAVDRTAKQVRVQVLGSAGDEDVIEGALDAAAPLVLAGNYQLKDGMKIRAAASADQPAR